MESHSGIARPSFRRALPGACLRLSVYPPSLGNSSLNPASYHSSVSHSRLGALPGQGPLFVPPSSLPLSRSFSLSSLHSLSTNYFSSLSCSFLNPCPDTQLGTRGALSTCPLATRLPRGAWSMGWALPSSLEHCTSEHGKGPLSLERAELLQEEGNLAFNQYGGQAWLGWEWEWGPEGELSFLHRNCGPRRT